MTAHKSGIVQAHRDEQQRRAEARRLQAQREREWEAEEAEEEEEEAEEEEEGRRPKKKRRTTTKMRRPTLMRKKRRRSTRHPLSVRPTPAVPLSSSGAIQTRPLRVPMSRAMLPRRTSRSRRSS